MTIDSLIAGYDWNVLLHAYDTAEDVPAVLRRLVIDETEDAAGETYEFLWGSVLHQGTMYTSTAPVARIMAAVLDAEVLSPSKCTFVLNFFGAIAESLAYHDDIDDLRSFATKHDVQAYLRKYGTEGLYEGEMASAALAQAVVDCFDAVPSLAESTAKWLDAPGWEAVSAACALHRMASARGEVEAYAEAFAARIVAAIDRADDPDPRAGLVLALADFGGSVSKYLEDPSPWVRVCAALRTESEVATALLSEMLIRDPKGIDELFERRPPQFHMRVRFAAVHALLSRTEMFEELVDVACAVAGVTHKYCVDSEWGPLIARAFDGREVNVLTAAQLRFLEALLAADEVIDDRNGNASIWLSRAGLPGKRAELEALVIANQLLA